MTLSVMTFHESYGDLPKSTLRLIRKFNVSPSDYDVILDRLGDKGWDEINGFITVSSEPTGYYRPSRFF